MFFKCIVLGRVAYENNIHKLMELMQAKMDITLVKEGRMQV